MNDRASASSLHWSEDHALVPKLIVCTAGHVLAANKAASAGLGDIRDCAAIGLDPAELVDLDGSIVERDMPTPDGIRRVRLAIGMLPDAGHAVVQVIDIDDLARRIARLQDEVHTDELTKVGSRRRLFDEGARMLADLRRHGTPLAIAIADLDGFKQVNDSCGHSTGDLVLAYVADVMQASLRRVDLIGRYGGDEFAVLMPHTGLSQAKVTIARMVDEVTHALQTAPPARILPTISVGITAARAEDADLAAVLARADQALYRAKLAGTNRIAAID